MDNKYSKINLIIAFYFLIFWIGLPGILISASVYFDETIFTDNRLHKVFMIPGILIFIPGILLFFTSVYQFKKFSGLWPVSALPPENIIEKGLFSVVRHPVYYFALLTIIGAGLIIRSKGFILMVLPVFILVLIFYIFFEEKNLLKRHEKKYQLYRERVPLVFPRFYNLMRILAYLVFKTVFGLKIFNKSNVPENSPFFVISSHRNYLDPFFISFALPFQVKHLCTFEMFRKPLIARILNWFGAIPKKRYKSDISSTKQIIKAIKEGYCVGIFPEGGRSWTGEMRSLKKESLKLLQRFHTVPIMPVRVEGNYHAWPRWSDWYLKAKVSVIFEKPMHLNENMTLEEIENLIKKSIEPQFKTGKNLTFKKKLVKSKLPHVIYRCPVCKEFASLFHIGVNKLACKSCQTSFEISNDLSVRYKFGEKRFDESIHDIYEKIKITERDILPVLNGKNNTRVIFQSEGKLFAEEGSRFHLILEGEILLTTDKIIATNNSDSETIGLEKIGAITIESNCKLQIHMNLTDRLYQIVFISDSVLKWQDFLELMLILKWNKKPIAR